MAALTEAPDTRQAGIAAPSEVRRGMAVDTAGVARRRADLEEPDTERRAAQDTVRPLAGPHRAQAVGVSGPGLGRTVDPGVAGRGREQREAKAATVRRG